jgi:hypothetical protein
MDNQIDKQRKQNCLMCGECCSFDITITLLDIHRICTCLTITPAQFFKRYLSRQKESQLELFLLAKKKNGQCQFIGKKGNCKIHLVKPAICKEYICLKIIGDDFQTAKEIISNKTPILLSESEVGKLTAEYIKQHGSNFNPKTWNRQLKTILKNQ